MDALILAAGHGTDLNPLTARRPKHLLPIGNRPGLAYMIEALRDSGFRRVAITVNGDEQHYRRLLGDGSGLGVRLTYLQEPAPLGTAGCLRAALATDFQDALLVVNANLIFSVDLRKLVRAHRESGAVATLGVIAEEGGPASRPQRERLHVGADGTLERMDVDYGAAESRPDYRAAGIYLFERTAIERIPSGAYYDLKEQFVPGLLKAGQSVMTFPLRGYLRELNTAEDYLQVHFDFCNGRTGSARVGEELADGIWVQGQVDMPPDVVVVGPVVLGPGVQVGSGARLIGPLVVGRGTSIGEGVHLRETVVGEDVVIGQRARVERSILADGLHVGDSAVIRDSLATAQPLSVGDLNFVGRDLRISMASLPFERYIGLGMRRQSYGAFKRAFDIAFGLLALVLALPVMAIVAVAILLNSGRPILFRQKRCGKDGTPFFMLKFRSMRVDAEQLRQELKIRNEMDGPVFKIANDPRFTRVGRFLRKYSLDELPQLWNVLAGDMSIVGPRPLQDVEMRVCPSWREARMRVKPGLTGLWQVSSREKGRFQDWIQHDLRYVRSQSFSLDFKIILRTIMALAKGL
jgi:lipopolysaccharide/colanic/teichoic acid biosynthesis glycosyltransferase/NDP-sugar pyrophosphorylase family protein